MRNFGLYEKIVNDIQFCGKYRELMCLCPRATFDLVTEWIEKFGKERTYDLIMLVCDCTVPPPPVGPPPATPPPPTTSTPGLPPGMPPPPTPPAPPAPPPQTSTPPPAACTLPPGGG